jgi:hypothetical protein
MNLGQYERDFPEMITSTAPERRGFINEVAFATFCDDVRKGMRWPFVTATVDQIHAASESVRTQWAHRNTGREARLEGDATDDEIEDIREQHSRMMRIFASDDSTSEIVAEPVFPGCGIIDTCIGDLLASNTLFEVKAGDRRFRSIDVRQLVTYATLNHISKRFEIRRVGLFNPRIGIRMEIGLDELCLEISGKNSVDLLTEITMAISSGDTSR